MFDVITIGGATRDIAFITDKGRVVETPENLTEQRLLGFEYGAKIRSEEVYLNFGSGACNAAATFAKMGLSVAACVKIGGDENGKSILENLRTRNINTDLVQKDDAQASGFSFVVLNKNSQGERVIFVHKGASCSLSVRGDEIKNTKWIYLSALAGDWEDGIEKIAAAVKTSGVMLAWNPGETEIAAGKARLSKLLENTNIFIINKDEAIELVQGDKNSGLGDDELNDTDKLTGIIKSWGPEIVIITDGKNGARLSSADAVLTAPAFIGQQIDTTGAGDAFGSGFLAGYILSDQPETALKFGILNSSGTVGEYGAQNGILDRSQAEAGLDAVRVEKIK